jgi:hypothetical protein
MIGRKVLKRQNLSNSMAQMQDPKIIKIPTINNGFQDYSFLFGLWPRVNKDNLEVRLDFSSCTFLGSNAVAYLAGLYSLIKHRGGNVTLNPDKMQSNVRANLAQNNFFNHCGLEINSRAGNSIPVRHDVELQKEAFISYLKSKWIGTGWIGCSAPLRNMITSKVCEIYVNAFEHSQSPVGIFSCGQHYPNLKKLELTLVDFGVGIPYNVRSYFQRTDIQPSNALRWAFYNGNSTKRDDGIARGVGLSILEEFIQKNSGYIQIFSEQSWGRISEKSVFVPLPNNVFPGTLITITLKSDEKYYDFTSEGVTEVIF